MATIQVDERVRRRLFSFAAELQQKAGRRVSLSEAITQLLEAHQASRRDKEKVLALFGCLKGEEREARSLLQALRQGEERQFEAFTGKPHP